MKNPLLIGAIEAGGTKFVLATGTGPDDLRDLERIPTTTPEETLGRCVDYLQAAERRHGPLSALGVASFGPVGLDRARPDWGFITTTPKPGWRQTDLAGFLQRQLEVPVGFDTDVNGAGLAEWKWGAGRESGVVLYLTVGTGIGGGVIMEGRPLHGLLHPEMGHIFIRKPAGMERFAGTCPWHRDCLEGLASGPAIAARWGAPAPELPPDHEAWGTEAECLAAACASFTCTLSPHRIVLGGGVMETPGLLEKVQGRTAALLNGYLPHQSLREGGHFITRPGLGNRSGILGALALGQKVAQMRSEGRDPR